jgi:DNA invertase Pin-like site-specific DNA recombinase
MIPSRANNNSLEAFPLRAAEYMRMSTEHQQYSIANQAAAIQEYANRHSIEITRTYVDRGKSGLTLSGRQSLISLLQTVESGAADFQIVLIYDVSRWGRFQDTDESAYYEFALKKSGVRVIYCAETFSDDDGPVGALMKALKRAMAAEFSRELSKKVSDGQRRIAQLGYRLGGSAGFGLRRMVIDPAGTRRIVLASGERKSIQTDRITLVPGPEEEVRAVHKVFDLFVNEGMTESKIAGYLSDQGVVTRFGNRWHKKTIRDMLTNPKYVGDLVFNRTVTKLRSPPKRTAPESWIYVPDRFEPIVHRGLWNGAQSIYKKRAHDGEEGEMLNRLSALLARHGRLTGDLIDAAEGMMRSQTYRQRFGSLIEAYRRVGFGAERRYRVITRRPALYSHQKVVEQAITARLAAVAETVTKHPKLSFWKVNESLSVYVSLVGMSKAHRRRRVWGFYGNRGRQADVLVVARFDPLDQKVMDYFLFPGTHATPILIYDENPWSLAIRRFPDLSFLDALCGVTTLEVAT